MDSLKFLFRHGHRTPAKSRPEKCPDCGANVRYYHDADETQIVCSKQCQGFKSIDFWERKHKEAQHGIIK